MNFCKSRFEGDLFFEGNKPNKIVDFCLMSGTYNFAIGNSIRLWNSYIINNIKECLNFSKIGIIFNIQFSNHECIVNNIYYSNPNNLKIGTLDQEIGKIVRGRATNPKWIKSIMKHGYKGAFELLATLDYLYAYQATTGLVKNHHFDLLFESYIADENVYEFIKYYNPDALNDIKIKFIDAIERKLWHPRRNDTKSLLEIERE